MLLLYREGCVESQVVCSRWSRHRARENRYTHAYIAPRWISTTSTDFLIGYRARENNDKACSISRVYSPGAAGCDQGFRRGSGRAPLPSDHSRRRWLYESKCWSHDIGEALLNIFATGFVRSYIPARPRLNQLTAHIRWQTSSQAKKGRLWSFH